MGGCAAGMRGKWIGIHLPGEKWNDDREIFEGNIYYSNDNSEWKSYPNSEVLLYFISGQYWLTPTELRIKSLLKFGCSIGT